MTIEKSECLFCNLANGKIPTYSIYQNDLVNCFLDIDPIADGHILVVPKQHLLEIDSFDVLIANHIMQAAILVTKAIKHAYHPDGVSMMQNGGYFNEVNHYHLHVFPRYRNDGFSWIYPDDIESNEEIQTRRVQSLRNAVAELKLTV